MRTQARFRSRLFEPPVEGTDPVENGRALAEWLCAGLPAELLPEPIAEDWGYRIVFAAAELNAMVSLGCGHVDGDQWSCFCDPYRSFMDRWLRRPLPLMEMERVIRALDSLLADRPDIHELEWFENDERLQEFNHAARAFDG